jgi:hypothetical protein
MLIGVVAEVIGSRSTGTLCGFISGLGQQPEAYLLMFRVRLSH